MRTHAADDQREAGDGPAQWPWWEQAEAAELHLMETQDPDRIDADAVSGAAFL